MPINATTGSSGDLTENHPMDLPDPSVTLIDLEDSIDEERPNHPEFKPDILHDPSSIEDIERNQSQISSQLSTLTVVEESEHNHECFEEPTVECALRQDDRATRDCNSSASPFSVGRTDSQKSTTSSGFIGSGDE